MKTDVTVLGVKIGKADKVTNTVNLIMKAIDFVPEPWLMVPEKTSLILFNYYSGTYSAYSSDGGLLQDGNIASLIETRRQVPPIQEILSLVHDKIQDDYVHISTDNDLDRCIIVPNRGRIFIRNETVGHDDIYVYGKGGFELFKELIQ